RLVSYPDVTAGYWTFEQINDIGTLGIITGYPDGKFKPEGNITRAELSALLVRTKLGTQTAPAVTKPQFKDVAVTHWASTFVDYAVKSNIVLGYPDKTFRPSANITRAEGLAMIARFGGVTEEAYTPIFRDINAKHWAAKIVAGSFRDGLLQFLRGKPFEPNKKLTRAEAVEILFRTSPVKVMVNDLMNFDKGYGTEAPKIEATPVK
ncbi:MAG TPA: S-layer homology domain-containing protein, partial [Candidatus Omnitrophota bacterium]|nr:S-layer homology domain-containing protein [Candidatus Omnitrophota bacterium]